MTQSSRDIILKAFLDKLSSEKKGRLLSFLPPEEKKRLDNIGLIEKEEGFGSLLELVHWSWFIPTLNTYSVKEQILFLNALPPSFSENLRQELGITKVEEETLTKAASTFLKQILLSSLTGARDRLLPPEFLPPTPLNTLLKLSKKELTHLIDLLSLYDLGSEMRQIVETKILKKIYSFLSEDKRKFLKIAMAHKEHYPPPRFGLDKWEGSEEAFHHLLHKRGLARMGTALSGQNPDLVWYICHQLDIGRGNTLFKLCSKEATPGVSESIIRQVEEILANPDIRL